MADDVLLNKAAAIERAVRRVREEYADDERNLVDNQTRQDAIILNLQRACEGSIDAAMHLVRVHRLGVPQESRDAFTLLQQAQLLDATLADRMKKMSGSATSRFTITRNSTWESCGALSRSVSAISSSSRRPCCARELLPRALLTTDHPPPPSTTDHRPPTSQVHRVAVVGADTAS
jgi:uncharacterized protein YutE (UPF0331/DUF86 family)